MTAVYKAINAVQAALSETGIAKDRLNTQGSGYKFRGIDDVYKAISPLLAKHGLCIIPRMINRICDERVSGAGKALFYVTVEAEFDFVAAEDGSKHTARTFGEAMDSGDKATNKAMSAAYKYAAFQTFAIPTEGNPDADSDTHDVQARAPRQAANQSAGGFNLAVAVKEVQAGIKRGDASGAATYVAGLPKTQKDAICNAVTEDEYNALIAVWPQEAAA